MTADAMILALDVSLSSTGYAIMGLDQQNKPVLIDKGHIKTKDKQTTSERLHQIADALDSILYQYPVKTIVRERGFSRFPKVTQALFRVIGIVDLIAFRYGYLHIEELPPTKIKKQLVGRGRASKAIVESVVRERLNLDMEYLFANDDESDAVAVGLVYLQGAMS